MHKKPWEKFEEIICSRVNEIDPYARRSKGSGNKGELHDINTRCGLAIEAKQRNTESITIKTSHWKHLIEEIPLHSDKIPVLALQNKYDQKWAVLDLDDFMDLYNELYLRRKGEWDA